MNVAAMNGGSPTYDGPKSVGELAPLNLLSGSLSNFDLVNRLNQKEDLIDQINQYCTHGLMGHNDDACYDNDDDTKNQSFQFRIGKNIKTNLCYYSNFPYSYQCTKSGTIDLSQSSGLKLDEMVLDLTNEKSTTTKDSKSNDSSPPKKFDAAEFIKEERRKLLVRLEKSEDDRIVFHKRSKKLRKNAKHDDVNYRGSRFWGVSKNKAKWQVMITLNHYKEYNGGFSDELEAARVYDKKSICTFGLKAKTNNDYTKQEVLEILKTNEPIAF